jgi:hypothetical protein
MWKKVTEARHVYKLQVYKLQVYKSQVYKLQVNKLHAYKSQVYKLQVYKLQVYKLQVYKLLVYKLQTVCVYRIGSRIECRPSIPFRSVPFHASFQWLQQKVRVRAEPSELVKAKIYKRRRRRPTVSRREFTGASGFGRPAPYAEKEIILLNFNDPWKRGLIGGAHWSAS